MGAQAQHNKISEIFDILKDLTMKFEETDKKFKETDKKFKETDKKFKETDKKFKETDKKFNDTNVCSQSWMLWLPYSAKGVPLFSLLDFFEKLLNISDR